jgi:hypothetical protein
VKRVSIRWTSALGAIAVALISGCASASRPAPRPASAPPPRPAAPAEARPAPARRVGEQDLAARERPEGAAPAPSDGVETTGEAPPDQPTLLASIGPSTPPERAASIRLTDAGRKLLEAGDTRAALDRIESAVKLDPSNPYAYYWLAQVHAGNGRPDQALMYADKAIVLFGSGNRQAQGDAYALRGRVFEQVGRFPDAREAYRRALAAQPNNVAARVGLARLGDPATTAAP